MEHGVQSTNRPRIVQPAIRAARRECTFNSSGKAQRDAWHSAHPLAELASTHAHELLLKGAETFIQVRNLEWPLCCNSRRSQPAHEVQEVDRGSEAT